MHHLHTPRPPTAKWTNKIYADVAAFGGLLRDSCVGYREKVRARARARIAVSNDLVEMSLANFENLKIQSKLDT